MKKIFFTSTLFLLFFSCKDNKLNDNQIVENAAENTKSSFPIKRLSKTQSLIDGIYYEKIKNDEKLQKLDSRFKDLQQDSQFMESLYNEIISTSENYYLSAENMTKSIKDSTLKKDILSILENSSDKFNSKAKKIDELKTQVQLNYIKLYAFYNAFKIRKTLPEIEKYQSTHPLKTDSLTQFINKQNKLLEELKILK